jgi:hypothetical protein
MNTREASPSTWSLWRPIVLDLVLPFVSYGLVVAFGNGVVWAMTAAGAASCVSTLINTINRKGLDPLGLLVMLELVAAIGILLFVRDARLLLVRPSIYTGIGAVYLMASAVIGRPLSFVGSRPMVAKGGPARLAAHARAWERSPAFRRSHKRVTVGFGVCLAVDSLARVLIVYTSDIERSAWLSKLPHAGAVLLMIGVSALAGRRWSSYVDEQM